MRLRGVIQAAMKNHDQDLTLVAVRNDVGYCNRGEPRSMLDSSAFAYRPFRQSLALLGSRMVVCLIASGRRLQTACIREKIYGFLSAQHLRKGSDEPQACSHRGTYRFVGMLITLVRGTFKLCSPHGFAMG